jgi:hypothetical protein
MTASFRFAILLLSCAGASIPLQAQTGDPFAVPAYQTYYNHFFDRTFPYLTPAQRGEFERALYPALDQDPTLVSDGLAILHDGDKKAGEISAADAKAYGIRIRYYEIRLRQAVLGQDRSLGPVFDAIEAHTLDRSR